MLTTLATILTVSAAPCGSRGAPATRPPDNYVFVGGDHARVRDRTLLENPNIAGVQMRFTWAELEPARDDYAFDQLRASVELLKQHGKRLFLQLQDVSFSDNVWVPRYLLTDTAFHGGVARKYEAREGGGAPRFDGVIARRWDPAVRGRFARLLSALSREFDGAIEGVVIPETATSFADPAQVPAGFTNEGYAESMKAILSDARAAFTHSCVILYANFMPGEWRRGNDRGFLSGVFSHAAAIGAGVGGPDIMPSRPGQRAHGLQLVEARPATVPAAMAVQDGNLAEKDPATGLKATAPHLHAFASGRLRLDYIFWGTEEPYYTSEILPLLAKVGSGRRDAQDEPMHGRFTDDYGNGFEISDTLFAQLPHGRFHLVEWHRDSMYVIARNDDANKSDPGKWTRIDWMPFAGMAPYTWGFCFTAYNAASRDAARAVASPDRANPRRGCNGYPFSRMKPASAGP